MTLEVHQQKRGWGQRTKAIQGAGGFILHPNQSHS